MQPIKTPDPPAIKSVTTARDDGSEVALCLVMCCLAALIFLAIKCEHIKPETQTVDRGGYRIDNAGNR